MALVGDVEARLTPCQTGLYRAEAGMASHSSQSHVNHHVLSGHAGEPIGPLICNRESRQRGKALVPWPPGCSQETDPSWLSASHMPSALPRDEAAGVQDEVGP